MKVLVTGAFGNVGMSTVRELIQQGHKVRIFDVPSRKNKRAAKKLATAVDVRWGDITRYSNVEEAATGMDVIIHLAAVIPPLADKKPDLAEKVNVTGTENVVRAIEATTPHPKLVFTSSIAVYGDRLLNPFISLEDKLAPNQDDHYALHKIRCEQLIKSSAIEWVIFRLSYIVSVNKLKMDPIMFDIPLATSFEICDTADVGLALANAVTNPSVWGETLHIAGGEKCRISYREYLKKMLDLFGVGDNFLPENAFKKHGFHCGFMDTHKSQALLHYQRATLSDYFTQVKNKMRIRRFFIRMVRSIAQRVLFLRSPYYHDFHKKNILKAKEA
jgi:nucleoside-diphosphate-sugar epimerase